MKVMIIEDEQYTADYLKDLLIEIAPDVEVIKMLSNISETVQYLQTTVGIELIFCDIHLSDGPSFEIFEQVKTTTPVIFVTAYDQYALQAFKANGIDYILKPFNRQSVLTAVNKYRLMYASKVKSNSLLDKVIEENSKEKVPTSILIKYGEKIKPVKIADVAFFITENKSVNLVTLKNEKFSYNKTLEDLEKICGDAFYRVNRQILLNKVAVTEVLQTYSRKLIVQLKTNNAPTIEINKAKMTEFLFWLSS